MKFIKLSDTYTKEDVEDLNVLMLITSMIMFAMAAIARIGGLV